MSVMVVVRDMRMCMREGKGITGRRFLALLPWLDACSPPSRGLETGCPSTWAW